MVTVCFTWRALLPVGEAEHRTPMFATLVRHLNEGVASVTLGRLGLVLAPPVAELKLVTAAVTDEVVAVDRDKAYAPARAAASVEAWSSLWQI